MKPEFKCLGSRILVVAVVVFPGTWKCFIDQVAGRSFDQEWKAVAETGSCIDEDLAAFLFPEWAKKYTYGR